MNPNVMPLASDEADVILGESVASAPEPVREPMVISVWRTVQGFHSFSPFPPGIICVQRRIAIPFGWYFGLMPSNEVYGPVLTNTFGDIVTASDAHEIADYQPGWRVTGTIWHHGD